MLSCNHQSGEKLQLKTGKTAEIAAQIPAKILGEAPSEIAMWYFDNGLGLWKEEGKAKKENGKYIANVSHFSCWNYDYYLPSIILSGQDSGSKWKSIAGNACLGVRSRSLCGRTW